jgi:hypothetical protein
VAGASGNGESGFTISTSGVVLVHMTGARSFTGSNFIVLLESVALIANAAVVKRMV